MLKQVIVMRKDLNMRKGKMIAQGAHASMKVFFDRAVLPSQLETNTYTTAFLDKDIMMSIRLSIQMFEWVNGIFTKICVSVDSEEELLEIEKKAKEKGLPVALIQDAGKTEFKEPTYTCCAIGPDKADIIDEITGRLKLL